MLASHPTFDTLILVVGPRPGSYTIASHNKGVTICFYAIISEKSIFHISFDQDRHARALNSIKKEFTHLNTPQNISISTSQLRQLLTDTTLLPPYTSSPFLHRGTPFQQNVWTLIEKIPFGETKTYGDLATQLGNPSLARAVGNACNQNPVAVLIPCHRVVGRSGLGGFAGGNEVKKGLLELEE